MTTAELIKRAAATKSAVAMADTETKNKALMYMADSLSAHTGDIIVANREDVAAARGSISDVMIDRLALDEKRIDGMAQSMRSAASLEDPVGRVLDEIIRPNGLRITKVSVPLGLLAIIYESRPNVTSDAAALALKSGNACILRGGKEAIRSNKAIVAALREGIAKAGLPEDALCLVEDTTRESSRELMEAVG